MLVIHSFARWVLAAAQVEAGPAVYILEREDSLAAEQEVSPA